MFNTASLLCLHINIICINIIVTRFVWSDFIVECLFKILCKSTGYFDDVCPQLATTSVLRFVQAVIWKDEWSNGSFQVLLLFQVPICCSGRLFCNQKQRHPAVSRAHYDCTTGKWTVFKKYIIIILTPVAFLFIQNWPDRASAPQTSHQFTCRNRHQLDLVTFGSK